MDFSPKNLIRLLEERGWVFKRINGSHHVYYNPETKETLPIPIHGNRDMRKGLFLSLLKKAGIAKNEVGGR